MKWKLVLTAVIIASVASFMAIQRQVTAQEREVSHFQAPVIDCVANLEPMVEGQSSEITSSGCEIHEADGVGLSDNSARSMGHCVTNIDPIASGKTGEQSSAVKSVACFATFQEAISSATGGTVELAAEVNAGNAY